MKAAAPTKSRTASSRPPSLRAVTLILQEGEQGIHQTELGIWDPFSVEDLLQKGVLDHLEEVSTISTNASKEFSLEKALDKMHADWEGLEFRIVEYKDTGTFIMGGTDEVQVRAGRGCYFLLC